MLWCVLISHLYKISNFSCDYAKWELKYKNRIDHSSVYDKLQCFDNTRLKVMHYLTHVRFLVFMISSYHITSTGIHPAILVSYRSPKSTNAHTSGRNENKLASYQNNEWINMFALKSKFAILNVHFLFLSVIL